MNDPITNPMMIVKGLVLGLDMANIVVSAPRRGLTPCLINHRSDLCTLKDTMARSSCYKNKSYSAFRSCISCEPNQSPQLSLVRMTFIFDSMNVIPLNPNAK